VIGLVSDDSEERTRQSDHVGAAQAFPGECGEQGAQAGRRRGEVGVRGGEARRGGVPPAELHRPRWPS